MRSQELTEAPDNFPSKLLSEALPGVSDRETLEERRGRKDKLFNCFEVADRRLRDKGSPALRLVCRRLA